MSFYRCSYFASNPLLEPLRKDPRYAEVMQLARQREESFRSILLRSVM